MIVKEVSCKSILNRSRIPTVDYAVNPYTGCGHGCRYCYAVFMKRFAHESAPWGEFVHVKMNAPRVLGRQLERAEPGLVTLSSVTDPYQPLEKKYRITRECLEVLTLTDFEVSVLTKSDLVLRDLDVLQRCGAGTGMTITTLDEELRRVFEPGAPPVAHRLDALRRLSETGLSTWVFLGPVLPLFSDNEEALAGLFDAFAGSGAREVLVDAMHLGKKPVRAKITRLYRERFPEKAGALERLYEDPESYYLELREKVLEISSGFPFEVSFAS